MGNATPQTKRILEFAQPLYKISMAVNNPFPDHVNIQLKGAFAQAA